MVGVPVASEYIESKRFEIEDEIADVLLLGTSPRP